MTSLGLLSEQERSLLIRVARCPLISQAMASATHPCREIVGTQAVPEQERQVPEGWAGNLRAARIAFLSSNPSISMPAQGQPPATAEAYPVASWPDDQIAEFLGRRFDQAIRPRPFVRDSHYGPFWPPSLPILRAGAAPAQILAVVRKGVQVTSQRIGLAVQDPR